MKKLRILGLLAVAVSVLLTCGCDTLFLVQKLGFINTKGELVIEADFQSAQTFHDGYCAVMIGMEDMEMWGFIDQEGNYIIPPYYYDVRPFYQGYAPVMMKEKGKQVWSYIDTTGIDPFAGKIFSDASVFVLDLAPVKDIETGLYGYIGLDGEYVISPQFEVASIFDAESGLAMFRVSV